MKGFLKFIGIILSIIMVIWTLLEFLAVPAFLTVIGLLNNFPWQYYAISIGGYLILFIIIEIIAHFIFKAIDKKFTPFLERKFNQIFNKTSIDKPLEQCYNSFAIRELDETRAERESVFNYDSDR